MQTVSLQRHPASPDDDVRNIEVGVKRSPDGVLALTYVLDGDLTRIRVPAPTAPHIAHRLWEHTCFEAFVAVDGAPAYQEFNFSPSGEWASYGFRAYREVESVGDEALAPAIRVRRTADRLELHAHIPLQALSPSHPYVTLRIGLAAVIETNDAALAYWSLHHPPGQPDFHHADTRTLRLEPIQPEC